MRRASRQSPGGGLLRAAPGASRRSGLLPGAGARARRVSPPSCRRSASAARRSGSRRPAAVRHRRARASRGATARRCSSTSTGARASGSTPCGWESAGATSAGRRRRRSGPGAHALAWRPAADTPGRLVRHAAHGGGERRSTGLRRDDGPPTPGARGCAGRPRARRRGGLHAALVSARGADGAACAGRRCRPSPSRSCASATGPTRASAATR